MQSAVKRDSILKDGHRGPIQNTLPTTIDIPNSAELKIDQFEKQQQQQQHDSKSQNNDLDDIVEFHINRSRYTKKESVTMISHDMNTVSNANLDDSDHHHNQQQQRVDSNESSSTEQTELHDNTAVRESLTTAPDTPDSDSDEGWKDMNTQLDLPDIYNIKGEKVDSFIYNSNDILNDGNMSQKIDDMANNKRDSTSRNVINKMFNKSSSKQELKRNSTTNQETDTGYTRIAGEKQATKFHEMDQQFQYLFKNEPSNLKKLHQLNSTNSFSSNDHGTLYSVDSEDNEDELSPDHQLSTMKDMLTGSQKIAYAALVKLIIVNMHEELTAIRGSGSVKIMQKLAKAQKSFTKWSMTVMDLLYDHLGIQEQKEREMIEVLSCHGVEAKDFIDWLDTNLTVSNEFKNLNDIKGADVKMIDFDHEEERERLEIDVRWTLICDLFLIVLESSIYDSRSRTLLLNFSKAIGITHIEIYQFERRITDALEVDESMAMLHNEQRLNEKSIINEHKKKFKGNKLVKIGLATAAGGLVIGLSAGLLAPVIGAGVAAGLTTIGISGTSGFLAGAGGSAMITTGGILTGMRIGQSGMSNRVGPVKTFEFKPLHNNGRVNLILTVSGWMSGKKDDIRLPFSTVDPVMGDLYSLLWEPEMLTSMGQTIGILASEVLTQSIQQILGSTILIALMSAIQLPMMLSKLGYLLDNPWNVSLDRAWSAGLILADTLRRRRLGVRPITLVGFSLGARLIYSCLLELAKTGDFGLIENVYLFGSPFVVKDDQIALAKSVVSGRFVNGYSKKDWILGYLYRATSGGLSTVAGLSPINQVENFDCSEFVQGHMEYRQVMPKILKMLDWEVLSEEFVEIDEPDPEVAERQRKLISEFEAAAASDKAVNAKKKKKTWYGKLFGRPSAKNKEWWEMYEEGQKEKAQKEKAEQEKVKKQQEQEKLQQQSPPKDQTSIFSGYLSSGYLSSGSKSHTSKASLHSNSSSMKQFHLKHSDTESNGSTSAIASLAGSGHASDSNSAAASPPALNMRMNEDQYSEEIESEDRSTNHSLAESDHPQVYTPTNRSFSSGSSAERRAGALNFHVVETKTPSKAEGIKPFRLSSISSSTSSSPKVRTPSFKLNIIRQNQEEDNAADQESVSTPSKKSTFSGKRSFGMPIVAEGSSTSDHNRSPESINHGFKPLIRTSSLQLEKAEKIGVSKRQDKKLTEDSIDYENYDVPKKEDIKISYDDDFDLGAYDDNAEQADIKQKNTTDTTTTTNKAKKDNFIDYGDDNEFPTDEKNITMTFA